MQSALLYRFQAAMIGAIVAETIGIQVSGRVPARQYSLDQLIQFYAESLIDPSRIGEFQRSNFSRTADDRRSRDRALPVFLFFHEDFIKLRQTFRPF